jgi:hypothetical protein
VPRDDGPLQAQESVDGGIQVFFVECYYFGVETAKEAKQQRTCILADSSGQDHSGFEHCRNSHQDDAGTLHGSEQTVVAGPFQVNGHNRRTVENHFCIGSGL